MKCVFSLAVTALLGSAAAALASSEEAWAAFRQAVAAQCEAVVAQSYGQPARIEVNPFGSESYGVALVEIEDQAGPGERLVCIYDKKTGAAELTAPFLSGED